MLSLILCLFFSGDVQNLAAEDYYVREAAETKLKKWSFLTYNLCNKEFKDLEQRRRAKRIVALQIPSNLPNITFLAGIPLIEWVNSNNTLHIARIKPESYSAIHYTTPANVKDGGLLILFANHYIKKSLVEKTYLPWVRYSDGCEATRLLVEDMRKVGIPTIFINYVVEIIRDNEAKALRAN